MADIVQIAFSNVISWMKIIVIWCKFYWCVLPKDPIGNMAGLVKVMAWHWIGDKSISATTDKHDKHNPWWNNKEWITV